MNEQNIEIGDVITWDSRQYPSIANQYGMVSYIDSKTRFWCDIWYADSVCKNPIRKSKGHVAEKEAVLVRKATPNTEASKRHKHYDLLVKWIEDPDRYIVRIKDRQIWKDNVSNPLWLQNYEYELIDKMESLGYHAIEKFSFNIQSLMKSANPI